MTLEGHWKGADAGRNRMCGRVILRAIGRGVKERCKSHSFRVKIQVGLGRRKAVDFCRGRSF